MRTDEGRRTGAACLGTDENIIKYFASTRSPARVSLSIKKPREVRESPIDFTAQPTTGASGIAQHRASNDVTLRSVCDTRRD